MANPFDTDLDSIHHQPRKIDKKKRHRVGFTEDVQDVRATRVSFKTYVRQLEEDLHSDDLGEEWIVECGSLYADEDDTDWQEVAVCGSQEEAESAASEYEAGDDVNQYRVRQI